MTKIQIGDTVSITGVVRNVYHFARADENRVLIEQDGIAGSVDALEERVELVSRPIHEEPPFGSVVVVSGSGEVIAFRRAKTTGNYQWTMTSQFDQWYCWREIAKMNILAIYPDGATE